jgi:hypothetical protein
VNVSQLKLRSEKFDDDDDDDDDDDNTKKRNRTWPQHQAKSLVTSLH